jgi:hypothetical protein
MDMIFVSIDNLSAGKEVEAAMSDIINLAFELGRVVLKTWHEMDASKGESPALLRDLSAEDQERVILQKIGKYWNRRSFSDRPDGLVLVTNHRLVFLSKITTITTTTDYLSFPCEMIEDLETTRVWPISQAIRFQVQGKEYVFTFLINANEVADAIRASKQFLLSSLKRAADDGRY